MAAGAFQLHATSFPVRTGVDVERSVRLCVGVGIDVVRHQHGPARDGRGIAHAAVIDVRTQSRPLALAA